MVAANIFNKQQRTADKGWTKQAETGRECSTNGVKRNAQFIDGKVRRKESECQGV
jgi:hypothetical protein